jgi:hypothetical protein
MGDDNKSVVKSKSGEEGGENRKTAAGFRGNRSGKIFEKGN